MIKPTAPSWTESPPDQWAEATLVLAAHGSSRHPMGGKAVNRHAEAIRKQNLFKEVRTAFWKEEPRLNSALKDIETDYTYVVPVLASRGYITEQVLPKELGELKGGTKICSPVGAHPLLPKAVANSCQELIGKAGLEENTTTLLLVGHGNEANPASAKQTEEVAQVIREATTLAQVGTAYLDQEPNIENWKTLVDQANLVIVPFMISGGLHAAHDIPLALDILEELKKGPSLEDSPGLLGPFGSRDGPTIWYARPIGCEPFVTDLILESVARLD